MADVVEIILALRNVRQFVSGTTQASKGVAGVGEATEKAGKKAGLGWKGVAKWTGGAAAIYGATKFVKGSVSATEDLAKSTLTLQRATGLDAKTASEWATVTKARGINTKQMQIGLVKLSKTMEAARTGNVKANAALAQMGINQDQIAKGDVGGALVRTADAFALMKSPAEKAATAQALFGKSGQALVPLLSAGSAGLQEQLNMADKYGATISGKTAEDTKKLVAQQRELDIAMSGVKVQLGTALMPVIMSVAQVFVSFAQAVAPLTKNATAMKIAIGSLTLAFVAYKAAVMISTIQTLALNAAWLASPITWIIIGIVALVAGFVLLYTKVGWFRKAVQATWGWIKQNWPLLLTVLMGPFGAVTALVIKNFGTIRKVVGDTIHFIADRLRDLVNFVKRLPGRAVGLAGKVLGGVTSGFGLFGGQAGGTAPRGGAVSLVGERGPEVVSLPGGATVTPIKPSAILGGAGFGAAEITTNLVVDRRVLAQAVGHYTADQIARR